MSDKYSIYATITKVSAKKLKRSVHFHETARESPHVKNSPDDC